MSAAPVGIDGCRAGWVVAALGPDGVFQFRVMTDLATMFEDGGLVLAIDIPIGLPRGQPRACDLAARRVLGPGQGSRVFPAPSRAAMAGVDYTQSCALNRSVMGVGLSKQAHAIMPKIAQIDRLISPERQVRVREVHPEVSFCILNGAPLEHAKKNLEGRQERLAILRRYGISFDMSAERQRLGASRVAIDDLVDAAVAVITASRVIDGSVRVLGDGSVDDRGLRMEICA